MSIVHKSYIELFGLLNLHCAWTTFRRGKTGKKDVMDFELHLEDNLFALCADLHSGGYRHSPYTFFQVFDNKKRDIYKAEVRDRVVHQVVYEYLLSLFGNSFINDSYASRLMKGQYKAISALRYFIKLASSGNNRPVYVLKCDVRKYFDNIDHDILIALIRGGLCDGPEGGDGRNAGCGGHGNIQDGTKILGVIDEVISSYHSPSGEERGIPLGNVTSQIFANIYLNVLDQYVKNGLGCRYYVRYNDDIAIVSNNVFELERIRSEIIDYANEKLKLEIPIEKTSIRKVSWGIDFLGVTILPNAVLLRDKTKAKIYMNINERNVHSYLSILKHCNSFNLRRKILAMERLSQNW